MRVFAGPNGSGKSTVIQAVRDIEVNGRHIDFGVYINADDIARYLSAGSLSFADYDFDAVSSEEFVESALGSGLLGHESFSSRQFLTSFDLVENTLTVRDKNSSERLAQVIAYFLREKLLKENKKFSFETVFSHPGKVDEIRQAAGAGYKVYLYFVSTESPEVNKSRVKSRVVKGGHDVPPDRIEARYYRSLDLMFDAAQYAYQAFFFDNSFEGKDSKLFAHFKVDEKGDKQWDAINAQDVPDWFIKYYSQKVRRN